MEKKKTILFLSANPKNTSRIRLDQEYREITEGLIRSEKRDMFDIQSRWAVRLRDIRRALLDTKPQIVHFCGHGKESGLLVEDEIGFSTFISPEATAGLFELFSDHVQSVILNSCYSEPQVKAINRHIEYVVGMKKSISDKAAIEFSTAFYDALGAGKSYEEAFKFGRNAIQMHNIPDDKIPLLKKRNRQSVTEESVENIKTPGNRLEKIKISFKYKKSLYLRILYAVLAIIGIMVAIMLVPPITQKISQENKIKSLLAEKKQYLSEISEKTRKIDTLGNEIANYKTIIEEKERKIRNLQEDGATGTKRLISFQLEKITSHLDKYKETDRKHTLKVVGTNSLGPIHQGRKEITRILKKGGKVKFLLLDPESNSFLKRSDKEQDTYNRLSTELMTSLYGLKNIALKVGPGKARNIEVRLYSKMPKYSLMIVDADFYDGFIMRNLYPKDKGTPGIVGEMRMIEKKREPIQFSEDADNFEEIWKSATRIQLPDEPYNIEKWPYKRDKPQTNTQ